MQGSLGFHLQQRSIPSVSTGGGLHAPSPLRPTTTAISLASPSSDGAGSPHNLMNMNIGQAGTYSGGIGSPNVARPDPQKRKRGRPRKYPGTEGGGVTLGTSLALTPVATSKDMSSPLEKRGRGRPPGSGKKQQLAAFGISSAPLVVASLPGFECLYLLSQPLHFVEQVLTVCRCLLVAASTNGSYSRLIVVDNDLIKQGYVFFFWCHEKNGDSPSH